MNISFDSRNHRQLDEIYAAPSNVLPARLIVRCAREDGYDFSIVWLHLIIRLGRTVYVRRPLQESRQMYADGAVGELTTDNQGEAYSAVKPGSDVPNRCAHIQRGQALDIASHRLEHAGLERILSAAVGDSSHNGAASKRTA